MLAGVAAAAEDSLAPCCAGLDSTPASVRTDGEVGAGALVEAALLAAAAEGVVTFPLKRGPLCGAKVSTAGYAPPTAAALDSSSDAAAGAASGTDAFEAAASRPAGARAAAFGGAALLHLSSLSSGPLAVGALWLLLTGVGASGSAANAAAAPSPVPRCKPLGGAATIVGGGGGAEQLLETSAGAGCACGAAWL